MSGYEWVCPTSVERRVQYLLKVLMDSKSSKKTLKRDGPKRNVMGFKNYIYLKSKMALRHSHSETKAQPEITFWVCPKDVFLCPKNVLFLLWLLLFYFFFAPLHSLKLKAFSTVN